MTIKSMVQSVILQAELHIDDIVYLKGTNLREIIKAEGITYSDTKGFNYSNNEVLFAYDLYHKKDYTKGTKGFEPDIFTFISVPTEHDLPTDEESPYIQHQKDLDRFEENFKELYSWQLPLTYESWIMEEQAKYDHKEKEIAEAIDTLRHYNKIDLLSDKGLFYGVSKETKNDN